MKRVYIMIMLAIMPMLLVGCIPGELLRQARQPRIEPVSLVSGGHGSETIALLANTNCAEVGEIVTFTLRIANQMTEPMTITGQLVLDIVLQPNNWTSTEPESFRYWSQSTQYPVAIDRVLVPGEEHIYQWQWVAKLVYSPPNAQGVIASVNVGLIETPSGGATRAGDVRVAVGVDTMPGGESPAGIQCKSMKPL